MKIRNTKPYNNKFYQTRAKGGYSWCVQGNTKVAKETANVLPNCVGYACGRFNEIIGAMKYPQLNCNAENFIERAKSVGLQISEVPTLGGIMVWQRGATLSGNDGAGHVAIVERIDNENQIYTSESNWSGPSFFNALRNNNNGRWGLNSAFKFRGCIVNPTIGFKPYIAKNPIDEKSNEELAAEVIRGVYGNGEERKAKLGERYSEVQARVNQILNEKPQVPAFDLLLAVKKTIRGDYDNGQVRRNALGNHYEEVQHQVNLNFKKGTTNWNNIRLY